MWSPGGEAERATSAQLREARGNSASLPWSGPAPEPLRLLPRRRPGLLGTQVRRCCRKYTPVCGVALTVVTHCVPAPLPCPVSWLQLPLWPWTCRFPGWGLLTDRPSAHERPWSAESPSLPQPRARAQSRIGKGRAGALILLGVCLGPAPREAAGLAEARALNGAPKTSGCHGQRKENNRKGREGGSLAREARASVCHRAARHRDLEGGDRFGRPLHTRHYSRFIT